MRQSLTTVSAALLLLLLCTAPVGANSGPPRYLGDQTGVLVPGEERRIHVDAESLRFDLQPGLGLTEGLDAG